MLQKLVAIFILSDSVFSFIIIITAIVIIKALRKPDVETEIVRNKQSLEKSLETLGPRPRLISQWLVSPDFHYFWLLHLIPNREKGHILRYNADSLTLLVVRRPQFQARLSNFGPKIKSLFPTDPLRLCSLASLPWSARASLVAQQ